MEPIDFQNAMNGLVPSSQRSSVVHARSLAPHVFPLLNRPYTDLVARMNSLFPLGARTKAQLAAAESEGKTLVPTPTPLPVATSAAAAASASSAAAAAPTASTGRTPFRARVLVHGDAGMGQTLLGPALLQALEDYPLYTLDLPTLLADPRYSAGCDSAHTP